MSLRWVLAAFGVAAVALSLPVTILVRIAAVQARMNSPEVAELSPDEQAALAREVNDAWMLLQHLPWFVAGALVAISAALAILARRAQLAASASATAS